MFARIQWRMAAGYVALIGLLLFSLGTYLIGSFRAQQLSQQSADLERQARLVARLAADRLDQQGTAGLDPLAKVLRREMAARITFTAPNGTVLGDSEDDPARISSRAARPEVVDALRLGTGFRLRRDASGNETLSAAVPVASGGQTIAVASLESSTADIETATNRMVAAILVALGVSMALATTLATLLARVTARPVRRLMEAARRFSAGDLDATIAESGPDEVGVLGRSLNEMAAALRADLQAVEAERSRLAAILGHMADGLVLVDGEGLVRLVNPAAERLLQTSAAQAQGQSAMAVLRDHELAALVDAALRGVSAAPEPQLISLGPAAHGRTVQAMASRIPGGNGGRVLLILQDVTELRRTEALRREFVSNVSHELRTPVASLKALVETLLDGALEDEAVARDFLERMQVEVDGLAQLVEELLQLSRIESGQLPLHLQSLDLGAVAADAAERLRAQAQRLGVELFVARPTGLPPVNADPDRIHQVVVNLVHNAVKFTPPGGRIVVRASARNGEVAVEVTDTGAGISPEALPRLFERFYKADQARTGGGTGLGLAIAKHLVQAQGGRIWAESAGEGRGATFTFALPVASAPPA